MEGLEDRTLLTTMSVLNTDDSGPGSLRQAIIDANAQEGADTIEFAESVQGTIALTTGQLAITDELTIDGPGADVLTVSGSGMSRVFLVTGTKVTMDDITIADGMATDYAIDVPDFAPFAAGGGLRNVGGDVTLNNVKVVGNTAQNFVASGAGVASGFGASTTINGSYFADNQAIALGLAFGGAISIGQGSLTVNDSEFVGNKAIAVMGLNPDVTFSGQGGGGAIFAANDAHTSIANSQFEGNVAKGGDGSEGTGQGAGYANGGAILSGNFDLIGYGPSTLNVTGSTFSGNQSIGGKGADGPEGVRGGNGGPGYGGGISLYGGIEASIASGEFIGNQVITGDGGNGGAGAVGGDSGVYDASVFSAANRAFVGSGSGAIHIDGAALVIIDSSFSQNVALGGAGGQGGNGGNGGNSSSPHGGAIVVVSPFDGTGTRTLLDMTNTALTTNAVVAGRGGRAGGGAARDGNDGHAVGGGILALSPAGTADVLFVNLTDVTITGNRIEASSGELLNTAGVLADLGANVTLKNVDISENKEISDGAELVVDGYTCEGILSGEGNCIAAQQGDANRDGKVDMEDFLALAEAFGQEGDWLNGDFDRDGTVGFADFLLLAANYGATNPNL